MPLHPLSTLSAEETTRARDIILDAHSDELVLFREVFLQEPAKAELIKYLDLEHAGRLSPTSPRPARLAKCQYDIIGSDKIPYHHEAVVDVEKKTRVRHEVIGKEHQAALIM